MIAGNLCGREVGEHISLRQDAMLFVQHGFQQHVGADQAFHQHVDFFVAGHLHTFGRSFRIAVGFNAFHTVAVKNRFGQRSQFCAFANQHEAGEIEVDGALDGF